MPSKSLFQHSLGSEWNSLSVYLCKLSERKGHQSRHQIKQLPAEAGKLIPSIWKGNILNYVFMHVIAGLYLVSLSSTMIQTNLNIMSKHFCFYNNISKCFLNISWPFPCRTWQFSAAVIICTAPGEASHRPWLHCVKVFIITKSRRQSSAPKNLPSNWESTFSLKMEPVDSGSNIPIIPSPNGYLCTTKNYIFDLMDSTQADILQCKDQGSVLNPTTRPVAHG